MPQTRYERLNTNSHQEERNGNGSSSILRRTSFTSATRYDDDDDDEENEEIELGTEHRLRYEGNGDNDEYYRNGHAKGNMSTSSQYARSDALHESGGYGGPPSLTSHLPGSRVFHMAIGTLATILLYLALSICLTFYQQSLIKKLKFPLTIVTYHLVIKFLLAACVRAVYKCHTGKTRVQLDWRTAWRKMAPTGVASGIDIGFSNWGLELVPISLYTMTKSSTIVFILFFAILLGLEKKSWSLVSIVGLIAVGLFMFTYESAQFDAMGFVFILVASLSSGIRWTFAQFVMQKSKLGLHNPIDMIYYMQPWMIVSLLPFLIAFERADLFLVFSNLPNTSTEIITLTFFKISFGAVLAFFMEVSEFLVLSKTSSLTLSIAGIFKDICQLALGVEINGDQLSLINVFGLIVCLAGISLHLLHKYSTLTKLEAIDALNDDDEDDLHFNETQMNANSAAGVGSGGASGNNGSSSGGNVMLSAAASLQQKKHSSLTIPLLEQTDSDDSNNEDNGHNTSDVIFDVLKRRDMPR